MATVSYSLRKLCHRWKIIFPSHKQISFTDFEGTRLVFFFSEFVWFYSNWNIRPTFGPTSFLSGQKIPFFHFFVRINSVGFSVFPMVASRFPDVLRNYRRQTIQIWIVGTGLKSQQLQQVKQINWMVISLCEIRHDDLLFDVLCWTSGNLILFRTIRISRIDSTTFHISLKWVKSHATFCVGRYLHKCYKQIWINIEREFRFERFNRGINGRNTACNVKC